MNNSKRTRRISTGSVEGNTSRSSPSHRNTGSNSESASRGGVLSAELQREHSSSTATTAVLCTPHCDRRTEEATLAGRCFLRSAGCWVCVYSTGSISFAFMRLASDHGRVQLMSISSFLVQPLALLMAVLLVFMLRLRCRCGVRTVQEGAPKTKKRSSCRDRPRRTSSSSSSNTRRSTGSHSSSYGIPSSSHWIGRSDRRQDSWNSSRRKRAYTSSDGAFSCSRKHEYCTCCIPRGVGSSRSRLNNAATSLWFALYSRIRKEEGRRPLDARARPLHSRRCYSSSRLTAVQGSDRDSSSYRSNKTIGSSASPSVSSIDQREARRNRKRSRGIHFKTFLVHAVVVGCIEAVGLERSAATAAAAATGLVVRLSTGGIATAVTCLHPCDASAAPDSLSSFPGARYLHPLSGAPHAFRIPSSGQPAAAAAALYVFPVAGLRSGAATAAACPLHSASKRHKGTAAAASRENVAAAAAFAEPSLLKTRTPGSFVSQEKHNRKRSCFLVAVRTAVVARAAVAAAEAGATVDQESEATGAIPSAAATLRSNCSSCVVECPCGAFDKTPYSAALASAAPAAYLLRQQRQPLQCQAGLQRSVQRQAEAPQQQHMKIQMHTEIQQQTKMQQQTEMQQQQAKMDPQGQQELEHRRVEQRTLRREKQRKAEQREITIEQKVRFQPAPKEDASTGPSRICEDEASMHLSFQQQQQQQTVVLEECCPSADEECFTVECPNTQQTQQGPAAPCGVPRRGEAHSQLRQTQKQQTQQEKRPQQQRQQQNKQQQQQQQQHSMQQQQRNQQQSNQLQQPESSEESGSVPALEPTMSYCSSTESSPHPAAAGTPLGKSIVVAIGDAGEQNRTRRRGELADAYAAAPSKPYKTTAAASPAAAAASCAAGAISPPGTCSSYASAVESRLRVASVNTNTCFPASFEAAASFSAAAAEPHSVSPGANAEPPSSSLIAVSRSCRSSATRRPAALAAAMTYLPVAGPAAAIADSAVPSATAAAARSSLPAAAEGDCDFSFAATAASSSFPSVRLPAAARSRLYLQRTSAMGRSDSDENVHAGAGNSTSTVAQFSGSSSRSARSNSVNASIRNSTSSKAASSNATSSNSINSASGDSVNSANANTANHVDLTNSPPSSSGPSFLSCYSSCGSAPTSFACFPRARSSESPTSSNSGTRADRCDGSSSSTNGNNVVKSSRCLVVSREKNEETAAAAARTVAAAGAAAAARTGAAAGAVTSRAAAAATARTAAVGGAATTRTAEAPGAAWTAAAAGVAPPRLHRRRLVVTVFTDGACPSNGQQNGAARGGVGVFFGYNDPRNVSCRLQGQPQTNQRAELQAVLECLLQLKRWEDAGRGVWGSAVATSGEEQMVRCSRCYGLAASSAGGIEDRPQKRRLRESSNSSAASSSNVSSRKSVCSSRRVENSASDSHFSSSSSRMASAVDDDAGQLLAKAADNLWTEGDAAFGVAALRQQAAVAAGTAREQRKDGKPCTQIELSRAEGAAIAAVPQLSCYGSVETESTFNTLAATTTSALTQKIESLVPEERAGTAAADAKLTVGCRLWLPDNKVAAAAGKVLQLQRVRQSQQQMRLGTKGMDRIEGHMIENSTGSIHRQNELYTHQKKCGADGQQKSGTSAQQGSGFYIHPEDELIVQICCDSAYVVNCITSWMQQWKANNWRKKDKTPVKNRDLLEAIDILLCKRTQGSRAAAALAAGSTVAFRAPPISHSSTQCRKVGAAACAVAAQQWQQEKCRVPTAGTAAVPARLGSAAAGSIAAAAAAAGDAASLERTPGACRAANASDATACAAVPSGDSTTKKRKTSQEVSAFCEACSCDCAEKWSGGEGGGETLARDQIEREGAAAAVAVPAAGGRMKIKRRRDNVEADAAAAEWSCRGADREEIAAVSAAASDWPTLQNSQVHNTSAVATATALQRRQGVQAATAAASSVMWGLRGDQQPISKASQVQQRTVCNSSSYNRKLVHAKVFARGEKPAELSSSEKKGKIEDGNLFNTLISSEVVHEKQEQETKQPQEAEGKQKTLQGCRAQQQNKQQQEHVLGHTGVVGCKEQQQHRGKCGQQVEGQQVEGQQEVRQWLKQGKGKLILEKQKIVRDVKKQCDRSKYGLYRSRGVLLHPHTEHGSCSTLRDVLDVSSCWGGSGRIEFVLVKGHNGIEGNEMADRLACAGARLPLIGDDKKERS